jgi:adducin
MLYNEITASSLVKVDMQGSVVEAGTTNFGVNVAGFMLHSAIHSARPDIKCIIHIHTPSIVAVSNKCNYMSEKNSGVCGILAPVFRALSTISGPN